MDTFRTNTSVGWLATLLERSLLAIGGAFGTLHDDVNYAVAKMLN